MAFNLLETVALNRDLPEYGLRAGDLGAVVEVYDRDDCFEVEFVTASGRTRAVETLRAEDLRPVGDEGLLAVRSVGRGAA